MKPVIRLTQKTVDVLCDIIQAYPDLTAKDILEDAVCVMYKNIHKTLTAPISSTDFRQIYKMSDGTFGALKGHANTFGKVYYKECIWIFDKKTDTWQAE